MAKPNDVNRDVIRALEQVPDDAPNPAPLSERRKLRDQARRTTALSLRLAGLSEAQIAERLEISEQGVADMLTRTLARAENRAVDQMRAIENERLDKAQAAIWADAMKGDLAAIRTFLQISNRRSKINGLDAPTNINLNVGIRTEMEQALTELEQVVLGEVISAATDDDRETG